MLWAEQALMVLLSSVAAVEDDHLRTRVLGAAAARREDAQPRPSACPPLLPTVSRHCYRWTDTPRDTADQRRLDSRIHNRRNKSDSAPSTPAERFAGGRTLANPRTLVGRGQTPPHQRIRLGNQVAPRQNGRTRLVHASVPALEERLEARRRTLTSLQGRPIGDA